MKFLILTERKSIGNLKDVLEVSKQKKSMGKTCLI